MASSISALTGSSNPSTTPASTGLGSTPPTEQVFLQLLVSQIKNQDPLNPTDSTQFVTQLAQFSELENVIGIRTDIEQQISANATPPPALPVTPTAQPAANTSASNGTTAQ